MGVGGVGTETGDVAWALAKSRADVIRALLAKGGTHLDPAAVKAAAAELGIGHTTLYRLIVRFRAAELTSALLPSRRGRPVGARSLEAGREKIIADEIGTFYLRAERPRLSDLVEKIAARCHQVKLPVPNWRTISSRVRSVDAAHRARGRNDTSVLQNLVAVFVRRTNGHFIEARYRTLGYPPISLWERNEAVRELNARGRSGVDKAMIFKSVMEQRSIEDDARRLTARSRRNHERRPVSNQDGPAAAQLHDIDTAKLPTGEVESGSAWDEP